MDYSDYFNTNHIDGEVTMDEFVSESMRTDLRFSTNEDELNYLRNSRITLKNEVLTCYQFMKENNLLSSYHKYRDGE